MKSRIQTGTTILLLFFASLMWFRWDRSNDKSPASDVVTRPPAPLEDVDNHPTDSVPLIVASEKQDLGRIRVGVDSDEFAIEILNQSDSEVKIIRTEASCGCMQLGALSINPIPPNSTAEFRGRLRLNNVGQQRAFVRIFAEGQTFVPTVELTWEPLLGIDVSPKRLFVDRIRVGTTVEREVRIFSTAEGDAGDLIESIEVKPQEWVDHRVTERDGTATIVVLIRASDSAERRHGTLKIKLSGYTDAVRIPLEWNVVDSLSLEPRSVYKGNVKPESDITTTFVIRGARSVTLENKDVIKTHRIEMSSSPVADGVLCSLRCLSPSDAGLFSLDIPLSIIDSDELQQERRFTMAGVVTE
ncbi:MAG: DUF1573 domain-containing protein [Planctomyces sp.]|nr:DUF1573 domain-containing protein [Planctomyces sp.]